MSTPDAMLAAAEAGEVYPGKNEAQPLIYDPDEPVLSLTLDQKQAWVLFVLLAPYKKADPRDWDIYRAAWDVRRRLAEAMGYQ